MDMLNPDGEARGFGNFLTDLANVKTQTSNV